MLKTCLVLLACISLVFAKPTPVHANHPPAKLAPAYAKWGLLAMQETSKKYPDANIIDYLHVGRQQVSPTIAQETFKFWLKKQHKEFGVYVRIQFQTANDHVLSIQFQPSNN
ncbi:MAG: hypothetical protein JWN30_2796 [Bacilli bacterium]|nr:hypothetical protein [Bacilli bacterium]